MQLIILHIFLPSTISTTVRLHPFALQRLPSLLMQREQKEQSRLIYYYSFISALHLEEATLFAIHAFYSLSALGISFGRSLIALCNLCDILQADE